MKRCAKSLIGVTRFPRWPSPGGDADTCQVAIWNQRSMGFVVPASMFAMPVLRKTAMGLNRDAEGFCHTARLAPALNGRRAPRIEQVFVNLHKTTFSGYCKAVMRRTERLYPRELTSAKRLKSPAIKIAGATNSEAADLRSLLCPCSCILISLIFMCAHCGHRSISATLHFNEDLMYFD